MRSSRVGILRYMKAIRSFSSTVVLIACVLFGNVMQASAQTNIALPGLANAVHTEVTNGSATFVSHLQPDTVLNFGILLSPRDEDKLTALVHNLGDPASPQFRQFLTPEQFEQQFGPIDANYAAVLAFAEASGFTITQTYKSHLLIDLSGTVAQIEAALHVSMNVYQHPREPRTFFSPDREPTLALPFAVLSVAGLSDFPTGVPALRKLTAATSPTPAAGSQGGLYLPSDMRAAYYGGTALTGYAQVVGLLQFQSYNISDITTDLGNGASYTTTGTNTYRISYSTQGTTFTPYVISELIDGASATPNIAYPTQVAESALDVAQAIGMAPGVTEVIQYIAPSASDDYDIFSRMANENVAKQISVSWLWVPSSYTRLDGIFAQMAAQGQNIFAATGDYGSWPESSSPYFPSEDAYVTAVGGTNLNTTGPDGSYISETGWGGSGGGPSPDHLALPSYQSSINSSNGASTTYRNAPDVALEAANDYACSSGACGGYQGTSFAAPRWAGFLALANQQAAQGGNTSIGFINPLLYSVATGGNYSSSFHDVTSGSNGSYSAGTNYDLVTGLGSPQGQSLITTLQAGAAPLPWTATAVMPQNSTCAASGSFSLTLSQ